MAGDTALISTDCEMGEMAVPAYLGEIIIKADIIVIRNTVV